jgi:DNA-directed RNA polymerase specialized sigma24 family protein
MDWMRDAPSRRQFDAFAAQAAGGLYRMALLMTGDPRDAEDAVQETLIRVARRWHRVQAMDHPASYARRILAGVALDGAERRSRHRAEPGRPGEPAEIPDDRAARILRGVDDLAEFRWALAQLRSGSAPCWCCAPGRTCRWPRRPRCCAARRRR